MTTEQRWSIGRELAERLGLDPDAPVIEWHRYDLVVDDVEPPPPPPPPPPAVSSIDATVLGLTPYAYWPLRETSGDGATDITGHGRHGSLGPGGARPTQGSTSLVPGDPSYYFDGGDYVVFGGATDHWVNVALSWSVRMRHESLNFSGGVRTIAARCNFADGFGGAWSWLLCVTSGGQLQAYIFTEGVTDPIQVNSANGAIAVGTTYSAGFSYSSATGTLQLFIDGALVGTGTRTTGNKLIRYTNGLSSAYTSLAAQSYAATNERTKGWLSHAAMFDRALSAADHLAIHNAAVAGGTSTPPTPPPPREPVKLPPRWDWVRDDVLTAALNSYRSDYGRRSVTERTSALNVSVQLIAPLLDELPTVGERFRLAISDAVGAALGLSATDRPRFTGQVTDVDVDDRGMVNLVGVGLRARLGRIDVGGDRWPAELDGARMGRILNRAAAQLPQLDVGAIDPGQVKLAQREPGLTKADGVVDDVLTAANGQLIEQRSGRLVYHDRDHRRGAVVALTLSAQLLRPFRWAQGIGSVINRARIGWGTDSPQRQAVVSHGVSVDQVTGLGPLELDVATVLVDEADAYAMGSELVGRRAWPTWQLPSCTVELVRSVEGALRGQLLQLRHGQLVHLAELPPGGPYTATDAWVEGTEESCTRTSWSMTLHLSDPAQGGVSLRWVDLPPTLTWLQLDPALTWLDLATADTTDLT